MALLLDGFREDWPTRRRGVAEILSIPGPLLSSAKCSFPPRLRVNRNILAMS
jgi:hypothetical protein